eukprot:scaffold116212_cov68-Cyclotella_meneghiniana.AAC.1
MSHRGCIFGLECFASNGLHGLNFELWEVWIGMLCQQGSQQGLILSSGRVKSRLLAPSEQGQ